MTATKRCSKCGQEFPATPEYFHRQKDGKYGLRPDCKICVSTRYKAHYVKNRDVIRGRHKQYYATHKARILAWNAIYRKTIPEKMRIYKRKWHSQNLEKSHAKTNNWAKAHPEATRAKWQRRRTKKLNAPGYHNAADIRKQYTVQQGKCYWCGKSVGEKYHVDHVIPLDRGGTNWPENLVIACPFCNASKGNKLPSEWKAVRDA